MTGQFCSAILILFIILRIFSDSKENGGNVNGYSIPEVKGIENPERVFQYIRCCFDLSLQPA